VSEEAVEKKPETQEFLVFLEAMPAVPNAVRLDVLDTVNAESAEAALDYVTGRLAEKDYIVSKVFYVVEKKQLVDVATALNP